MYMHVERSFAILAKQNHVYKENVDVFKNVYTSSFENDVPFQTQILCTQNASSPSSLFIQNTV